MKEPGPPVVERPIFFLDYDGTLAPIVTDPRAAYPHPDVPSILLALQRAHPVWIVTGRSISSLERLLTIGLPAIGVHGLEKRRSGGAVESSVPPVQLDSLQSVRNSVPRMDGIWIEEKGPTFAIHFRQAVDQVSAREALTHWAKTLPDDMEVLWGKRVLELRPRGQSKGHAVKEILSEFEGHIPVYLGDDRTDEDAFNMLESPAVTVKVGHGETGARYRLPDVEAVVAYLRAYI